MEVKIVINVETFLIDSNLEIGTYALVTYNDKTEATWFSRHDYEGRDWFLESPCELYKITEVDKPVEEFAKEYIEGLLEDDADEQEYINKWVLPMIIDNVLYEIENFQCSPYLPEEVDDIKLITEQECLEHLLKLKNEK